MNVPLEGVDAVSNIAITVADVPGSIVKCRSSELLNFTSGDAPTNVFLVSGHSFFESFTRYPFERWA
jgi:hypothetical protein